MNRLLLLSAAVLLTACGSGETDKIGRASTVFNILGKNDRIEVEGFDDPDVQGVACYISYAKKGGLKEMVNLEEDASDASVSCVQTASSISFDETAVRKPKEVFKHGASFAFKSRQIVRYYDPKRKTFAYLVYSDKIIQGSPKNSLSAVSCFGGGIPQTDGVQADTSGKLFAGTCMISNPIENPDKR
ncbi:TPA: CreA family protein [Neisseria meningitidis]|uniref:CreA family protein n=1 Tax=Neisseria meningitidis TaxID=487 RepID=UPI00032E4E1F|nr:CreA family protein [Neisseria meningitidis]EOC32308.1 creA family protein [Neisseria meningitidis 2001001]MCL5851593.1 CreA family protein [Neisseria meningitidis]MCL5905456.1 CreA family protein [Neisseria meningitidis]MDA3728565.1 CreA family protein [Neisseria meningitidis]CWO98162.1 CreA protein [Neisseria meningitidis]